MGQGVALNRSLINLPSYGLSDTGICSGASHSDSIRLLHQNMLTNYFYCRLVTGLTPPCVIEFNPVRESIICLTLGEIGVHHLGFSVVLLVGCGTENGKVTGQLGLTLAFSQSLTLLEKALYV